MDVKMEQALTLGREADDASKAEIQFLGRNI